MEQSETKEYHLGRMKNEIERKRNWRELPGFYVWILDFRFLASINGGTLVFFVRLVWLLVLEALFSKLRFRTIGHMKSHPGPLVLPAHVCGVFVVVVTW